MPVITNTMTETGVFLEPAYRTAAARVANIVPPTAAAPTPNRATPSGTTFAAASPDCRLIPVPTARSVMAEISRAMASVDWRLTRSPSQTNPMTALATSITPMAVGVLTVSPTAPKAHWTLRFPANCTPIPTATSTARTLKSRNLRLPRKISQRRKGPTVATVTVSLTAITQAGWTSQPASWRRQILAAV